MARRGATPWKVVAILLLVVLFGYVLYELFLEYGERHTGDEIVVPFKVEITVKDYFSGNGISSATVYIYDEAMNELETITTDSDGDAVSKNEYDPGTVLKIQAKATGYYTSSLYTFEVRGTTEYRTTVHIGDIKLYPIASSASLSGMCGTNTLDNNTTTKISISSDSFSVILTIQNPDDDSVFGSGYYVDYDTGKEYRGPVLVLTVSDLSLVALETLPDRTITVGGTTYYIWYLNPIMNDADDPSDGVLSMTIAFEALSTGDVTLTFSIYDSLYVTAIENGQFGTADAQLYDTFTLS